MRVSGGASGLSSQAVVAFNEAKRLPLWLPVFGTVVRVETVRVPRGWRRRMAVRGVAAAAAIAILAIVAPARAQKSARPRAEAKANCRSAYQAASERIRSGQLREASRFLQTCAKMQCESVLRRRCLATFTQLDSTDIPTIVPVVKDDAGAEQRDVQVMMDEEVLTTQIDGSALPVDPGLHEFSFSADGKVFATQRVIVAQGQRNRTISVSMPKVAGAQTAAGPVPAPTPGPSASDNPAGAPATPGPSTAEGAAAAHSVSPWAFAAGGVAGGGTVALLVLLGKRDTSTVLTDVSIGFSFGALVVATCVLLADRLKGEPVPPRAAYAVDVRPSSSGAVVSLRHTF
jgi:hypothetical protein